MYTRNSLYQNSSYVPYQEMTGLEGYMRPVEIQRVALEEIECPVIIGISNKPRIHWTQELHQRFDDAVNELGGLFSATPKNILPKMKVRGLTIAQVKSHLQKARFISRTNISEASGIQVNPAADSHPQLSQGEAYVSTPAPVDASGGVSFRNHNGGLIASFSGSSEIQGYNPDSMIVASQGNASLGYDCQCSFCTQQD